MSNREFTATRTMLANAFATAGAELLEYMAITDTAVAAIPDTKPEKYAIAGTLPGILQMAGKMMGEFADVERLLSSPAAGEEQTGELTDEQIIETMAKYSRFLEPGLYSQTDFDCPEDMIGFARAIERAAIAAHLARKPKAEQPSELDDDFIFGLADTHAEESSENGGRRFDRGGLLQFANDLAAHLVRQAQAEPVHVPEGFVFMPKRLTAENGAKGALSGEFKESVTLTCHECGGSGDDAESDNDAECPECKGDGTIEQDVPVTWETIKGIYKAAVALLAAPVAPAGAQNADTRDLAYLIEYIPDEAVRNEAKRKLAAGAQNAEAIRNQALEEAEDAVDKVMSEADDSGESAEAVGAYRCLKAIQALRIANGGSRV